MKQHYYVNAPSTKVQTKEMDGQRAMLFEHNLTRLDSENFKLLLERQKRMNAVTENLPGNKQETRLPGAEPNAKLYDQLVLGGGFRPAELPDTLPDVESALPLHRKFYEANGDGKVHAKFLPFSKEQAGQFILEKKNYVIGMMLEHSAEVVSSNSDPEDIGFMFEKSGTMAVRFIIGDVENPTYRLKLIFRRPEAHQRAQFRQGFLRLIDHRRKGGMGKSEMVYDLQKGFAFFNTYFETVSTEPDIEDDGTKVEYSEVCFITDTEAAGEKKGPGFETYNDSRKADFLKFFNPLFQVESASALVIAFSETAEK